MEFLALEAFNSCLKQNINDLLMQTISIRNQTRNFPFSPSSMSAIESLLASYHLLASASNVASNVGRVKTIFVNSFPHAGLGRSQRK